MPGTFRGFDYPPMAAEATADLPVEVLVADPALPEGDPATLPPYDPAPDDWRWLFYSSGTTADPKGAKHSDRSLSAANDSLQWGMQVTGDDKTAVVFPITHVGGLVWLYNTMQTGVELLMVETFDPSRTPGWLGEHGCTCAGAGTVFWLAYLAAQRALPEGERVLPDVRMFNGGGAPKPVTLNAELLAAFGAPLLNGWGLTESPINTMSHVDDPDDRKADTEGRAGPGVELRAALDGRVLDAGEEGELQVRGPQVCMGYLDSSLDAEAFDDDGWFRTGDLGTIDDEGYVVLTGRLKDVIIRKGENISAKEIEDLLHAHAKVAEAAVIGVPDDGAGRDGVRGDRLRDPARSRSRCGRWSTTSTAPSSRSTRSPSASSSSTHSPATRPARSSRRTSAPSSADGPLVRRRSSRVVLSEDLCRQLAAAADPDLGEDRR